MTAATRGRPSRFGDRRAEVLRAAARVFSERGIRNTTLEDVAAELNITRPALYHYTTSKEELLAECVELAQSDLRDALDKAQAGATGLERLRLFFRRYLEVICGDYGRYFVLSDMSEVESLQKQADRDHQRLLSASVQAMVREGIEDGSIRPCDPADVSRCVFAAFNGVPRWQRPGKGRTPGQIADDFLDILIGGLAPR